MVFINTTNAPALGSFIFRICPNFVPRPSAEAKGGPITDISKLPRSLLPVSSQLLNISPVSSLITFPSLLSGSLWH